MNHFKKWMSDLSVSGKQKLAWLCLIPLMMPFSLAAEDVSPLTTEPDQAFVEYVEKQGSAVTTEQAWTLVQEGYLVAQAISLDNLDGLKQQATSQRLHQANSLIWYFMWRASTVGTSYTEGMFDVPDPEGKYWDLFSSIPGSYSRFSSHYKGRILGSHMGVDLFPEKGEILPATKRTIVFNRMTAANGKQRLYLKPEDHGVSPKTPKEAAHHTWDYIRSRGVVTYFAPRTSPLPLREEFPESSDLDQYKQIVRKLPIAKEEKKRGEQLGSQYGYGGMVQFLAKDYPDLVKDMEGIDLRQEEIGEFLQKLSETFSGDLVYRTGKEAVIQPEWVFLEADPADELPAIQPKAEAPAANADTEPQVGE